MTIDPDLIVSIAAALRERGVSDVRVNDSLIDLDELARLVVEVVIAVGWDGF